MSLAHEDTPLTLQAPPTPEVWHVQPNPRTLQHPCDLSLVFVGDKRGCVSFYEL